MKRPGLAVGLFLLAATLAPPSAWAGRPLDTEDTGTVAPRMGELELSVTHERRDADHVWAPRAVVAFGLLPGLEVRVESGIAALEGSRGRDGEAGLGDSVVGIKYRLLDEAARAPAVLGAVAVRLPTGDDDRGLGAAGVDVTALIAVGKILGPVALTWNGGYTFVTSDRTADSWLLALAVEYRVAPAWWLVGEVVSSVRSMRGTRDDAVVRAGAVYAVSDRLKLDAAVGAGLTRSAPDVIVTVGLTLRLF